MTPYFSECRRRLKPPVFKADATAGVLLDGITRRLAGLSGSNAATPLDREFVSGFLGMLDELDRWQQHIIGTSEHTIGCGAGCSACCNHWVEDVNSFEAIIIADYLRNHHGADVARIARQCSDDCDELLRLEALTTAKLAEFGDALQELPDSVDLLLSVFFQMRRPCPLLDTKSGTCMVYPVRPLTCRMYVSVSDPLRCDPEYINDEVIPTCLMTMNRRIDSLLDALHERYSGGRVDDTGLRSQLARLL